jgi:hypothetical protein
LLLNFGIASFLSVLATFTATIVALNWTQFNVSVLTEADARPFYFAANGQIRFCRRPRKNLSTIPGRLALKMQNRICGVWLLRILKWRDTIRYSGKKALQLLQQAARELPDDAEVQAPVG